MQPLRLLCGIFICTAICGCSRSTQPSEELMAAAETMARDRSMRKSLLMDTSRPVSKPDEWKERYGLNDAELAALLILATNVHTTEMRKMLGDSVGYSMTPSQDYWRALLKCSDDMDEINVLVKEMALRLHVTVERE